ATPPRSSKTKAAHASGSRHSSRTQCAPAAADILSNKQAAESSPETPAPTPSPEPPAPPVRPAPGSAAKPPLQADSIWIGLRNIHPPLHRTTPTRLLKLAPAGAVTSSENTSTHADSQQVQPPSDSPRSYRNRTPVHPP